MTGEDRSFAKKQKASVLNTQRLFWLPDADLWYEFYLFMIMMTTMILRQNDDSNNNDIGNVYAATEEPPPLLRVKIATI